MALQDWETRKQSKASAMRSVYDYVMGILWIGIAFLFILNKRLGLDWLKSDPVLDYILGFVFLLYGGYRIYRGYTRNHR